MGRLNLPLRDDQLPPVQAVSEFRSRFRWVVRQVVGEVGAASSFDRRSQCID